jgi:hypothetical protein
MKNLLLSLSLLSPMSAVEKTNTTALPSAPLPSISLINPLSSQNRTKEKMTTLEPYPSLVIFFACKCTPPIHHHRAPHPKLVDPTEGGGEARTP